MIEETKTFDIDVLIGEEVEQKLLSIIHQKYPSAYKLKGKIKPFDIYIPELNIYIEVKSDKKSQYTGNIVVEVEMFNKPSGLNSTKADLWVFYTGSEFIYITPNRIWECVSRNRLRPAEFIGKGDVDSKKAYLVRKELLLEYASKNFYF
tara:strand:- start:53 stop:499 length:447 start_codon:yes stop_codon:yes gene_type:complete